MTTQRLSARVLPIICLLTCLGYAATARPQEPSGSQPPMLEFLAARSTQTWQQVPRKVLAFYYTWYGRPERHGRWVHWGGVDDPNHDIEASTHYPAKGAYDSHDPAIIDDHMDLAKQHGVDGFICTWWGQNTFDDRALETVLERAKEKDFTISIYWETAPGEGQRQVDRAVRDLLYVLERYGSHPSFLNVDGKPVIFVYGRVMNEVAMQQWPAIIREVERRYPRGCLLIADGYNQRNARLFDGIHTYNICGSVRGKEKSGLQQWSRESFQSAVRLAKDAGKISCITIIPGYDDTKIRKPGLIARREDGNTYRVLWEEAIRADPDWVLITSWNEWHEGSEIEPSWEDGDKYITMTGTYAKQFKKTPFSSAPIGNATTGMPLTMANELKRLYQDRPLAVLPDYSSDALFSLVDAGVPLRELTWDDVVSAEEFNARRYPIVVYAGYENYRQTLREEGDIDRSLIRYLEQGGLLMALPGGPFPFYYNERGAAVVSAGRFGLPIRSGTGDPQQAPTGWEDPPVGLEFSLQFNSDVLKDLPAKVALPLDGDQRWRPITHQGLQEGDIYLPLATLTDQTGRYWGDAMAYCEHKATAPKNGKCLYAWMRVVDLADRNKILYELLRLAAAKTNGLP